MNGIFIDSIFTKIYTLVSTKISHKTAIFDCQKTFVQKLVVKNFFGIIIYAIAFFVLLGVWNLRTTLTGLLAAAGMVGIVIELSLREVLSDLLAGIILFFDRPFRVGDSLVMGDIGGKVLDIGARSVKLKTWDGIFATIPNRKVASEVLKNYSKYTQRRLEVVVGVDYDSDLEKARKGIERAGRAPRPRSCVELVFIENITEE